MHFSFRTRPQGSPASETSRKTSLCRYRCRVWGLALLLCLAFWAGVTFLILQLLT
ncbi:hypothetical protein GCM10009414_33730 [Tatumella terrea]|uniref:hypothetical protein n=1 Tax=Tatumella terrea TaxID=419007 RepID=UPI0031CF3637